MLFNYTIVFTANGEARTCSGTTLQDDAVAAAANVEAAYRKITSTMTTVQAIELHAGNTDDLGTYASARSL